MHKIVSKKFWTGGWRTNGKKGLLHYLLDAFATNQAKTHSSVMNMEMAFRNEFI